MSDKTKRYIQIMSVCRHCGREFYTRKSNKEYCNKSTCQEERRRILRLQLGGNSDEKDLLKRVRLAEKYSAEKGSTVTYGQVSLFLEHNIKTF